VVGPWPASLFLEGSLENRAGEQIPDLDSQ